MTQILMIAPTSPSSPRRRQHQDLAIALQSLGHQVSVLSPRSGLRRRRRSDGRRPVAQGEIPNHFVEVPQLGRFLPSVLDAALRKVLPSTVIRAGMPRPDVMVVSAVDSSIVVARVLSVLYGVPYVLVLDQRDLLVEQRGDRFEQLLALSVQETSVVAATTPELVEQLRERFTLTSVQLSAGESTGSLAHTADALCARAVKIARGQRMVFHAPYPLDPAPASASRQRPNKMLAAFVENGHQVHRITGNPFQRTMAYRDLRRRVSAGQQVEFVYSENSTQPNVLATSIRHGFAPLLEARILAFCDRNEIPFGQFYRDVYWRFAESQASVSWPRRVLMQVAYRADLELLRRSHAHLFLPSMPMAPIVPFDVGRTTALPPGAPLHDSTTPTGIELLYVGGIGAGYALDEGLRALQEVEEARLTMVVRRQEWEAHRERYEPLLTERVKVVHAGADELQELYDQASACLLLVAPDGYRRFAVPLKLYEYLGYGKPTLASQGTLAGDLVEEMGSGFTVPNAHEDIAALLRRLAKDPALLERAAEHARAARLRNTWVMRAKLVAEVLTGPRET